MEIPALPPQGSTSYYLHYSAMDGAVRSLKVENILRHGALTTRADNRAQIQAAIDALPADGGAVEIPPGTFRYSGALVARNSLVIFGHGKEASLLHQQSTTADGISGVNILTFAMRNVKMVGPGSGTGTGVNLTRTTNEATNYLTFENVIVRSFGQDGIAVSNAIVTEFRGCMTQLNGRHGFHIYGLTGVVGTSTTFVSCFGNQNGGDGYRIDTMAYCAFLGCAADNNTGFGYYSVGGFGNSWISCGSEGNTAGAWTVSGGKGHLIQGGWIYRNKGASAIVVSNGAFGIMIRGIAETSPDATAAYFVDVLAGCSATVENLGNTKPNRFATRTTTILNDGVGNMVVAGGLEVLGDLIVRGTTYNP